MLPVKLSCYLVSCLLICILFNINFVSALDDDDDFSASHQEDKSFEHDSSKPLPKDKLLLKDIKTLTFYRNRRTTSRRTHSIHQLSCVGGTAGCKLFTPNEVHCENLGFNKDQSKFEWRCRADTSDRVRFNHVEVICEGYDYPEDDYILMGSCGLEFTLDYSDPQDYHHHSYFKHMDEHEKQMHHDRVKQPTKLESILDTFNKTVGGGSFVCGLILLSVVLLVVLVNFIRRQFEGGQPNKKRLLVRGSNYGPLASAVLTTKKAC